MKLSTALIAAASMAGAMSMAHSASATATVFEQYGYGIGQGDGAFVFVTTNSALTDITISGGFSGGSTDFGSLAAGGTTGYYYLGDNENSTPGSEGTAIVTILTGGKTYQGSFLDVLGDLDASDAPVLLGTINTPNGTVPEPATWALMLLGVGGLGATLRSSRKKVAVTA